MASFFYGGLDRGVGVNARKVTYVAPSTAALLYAWFFDLALGASIRKSRPHHPVHRSWVPPTAVHQGECRRLVFGLY